MAFDAIETAEAKTDKIIGGAAPYIALAARGFGAQPQIVSVVGGDFPQEYISILKQNGIDTDGIKIEKDGKTMFWKGRYSKDMNHRETLITELNVFADFCPVVPDSYKDSDILMLGNTHPSIQRSVIEQMTRRPRLIVMDTMNFWMDSTPKELEETIAMVDVLTINDEEARQLSGTDNLVKAAKAILAKGLQYLIIKKGDNGALLFSRDGEIFFAPALPLETVCDPTGAGDSFAGGFCGYIASKGKTDFETIKAAIIAGSVTGSFCCEKFGTENLLSLTESKAHERAEIFANMCRFNF